MLRARQRAHVLPAGVFAELHSRKSVIGRARNGARDLLDDSSHTIQVT